MSQQTKHKQPISGGLGSIFSGVCQLWHHRLGDVQSLLRVNQPGRFENGIKAVTHKATNRVIGRECLSDCG